jgi:pentatricopeptide repeat protein
MAVAARYGNSALALQALETLSDSGVPIKEQQLALLLESYVVAGQLPEAFKVLSSVRAAGFTPSPITAQPIVTSLGSAELIDQAFFALEDMYKAGDNVDITALNAVVDAAARLGDLPRARANQLAASDLGLSPDITTYNLVLEACVRAENRHLGDSILSELHASSLSPNKLSYELMIRLCLGDAEYEAAFYYLEKMKAARFTATAQVYQALLDKCVKHGDRRWKLVVEEAESLGYRLSQGRGNEARSPQRTPKRFPTPRRQVRAMQ